MDTFSTACFTGHRPYNLGISERTDREGFSRFLKDLEKHILYLHKTLGITYFISGMAIGVDTYAAKAVLNLRDCGLNIQLICVLPCKTQAMRWSYRDQQQYKRILRRADRVFCLSDVYTYDCMQRRNEFMVNNSSIVLAVWNGEKGGTANTVRYAKKSNIPIVRINPLDYRTKESKM